MARVEYSGSGVGRAARLRLGSVMVTASLVVGAAACATTPSSTGSGSTHRPSASTSTPSSSSSSPGTSTTTPISAATWLTYGGSFARTSLDGIDSAFNHAPTEAWTSPALDAPVYGEPLVDNGQVFVASENDTVYALSGSDGAIAWSDHLASPVPTDLLPCGDISPTVGVTSTMVIDPVSDTLFVSAETLSGSSVAHVVDAIDIATHKVLWRRDVDQGGWTASAQLQRIGLALSAGHVIVGFGGNFGDCGTYHGWVVGVPESGTGPLLSYEVPTAREGAIWAPAGVTVTADGHILVATGNGSAEAGQPFDHGNAVIELSPTLTEQQYFAPTNWAQDNAEDGDLGSTAVMRLDDSRLFIVGKEQTAYLLDSSSLGGVGGQLSSTTVCNARGGNAYLAPNVYVVCPNDGTIDQVRIGPGTSMTRGWTWSSPTGQAGSPTIAGGVLWTVDIGASILYGVDPSTGTTRYTLPLTTGPLPHFAAPSAAGGRLFVAGSTHVEAIR